MFGGIYKTKHLEKIESITNYGNGKFHNLYESTQQKNNQKKIPLSKRILIKLNFIFSIFIKTEKQIPHIKINALNVDFKKIDKNEDVIIWLGHSSCFIQIHGIRILVDPLFSEVSSPIPFFPKAMDGTNIYHADNISEIDFLIITHDHWDHLDYKTVLQLKPKINKIICPIGVGAHFKRWHFDKNKIIEMSWNESFTHEADSSFKIHCLPAHHSSGRGFIRNQSLWGSFLIESTQKSDGNEKDSFKIYLGGDSGYSKHYVDIGKKFAPIDFVLLNSGQYDKRWPNNHMNPCQVIQAAKDLGARKLIPIHICRVSIGAHHAWDEPLRELSKKTNELISNFPKSEFFKEGLKQISKVCSDTHESRIDSTSKQFVSEELEFNDNKQFRLLTPLMGEIINIKDNNKKFTMWWEQ
jgi:L-ascorbate metabolism protein UlaG (beta-lactamase superfamily)